MKGFVDNMKMLYKGVNLIVRIEKNYAFFLIVSSVFSTVPTFFSLNMISYIISELSGNKNTRVIILYVLITVLGNLILSLLLRGLHHIKDYYKTIFNYNEQLLLSQKIFYMDFFKVEDRTIRLLFERIKGDNHSGYNTYYLCRFLEETARALSNIIVSSIYFVSVLLSEISTTSKLLFALVLIFTIFANYFTNKCQGKINLEMSEKGTLSNAFFYYYDGFYSDYQAGKDVRLCNMQPLVCNEQRKQCDISYNIEMERQRKNVPLGILSIVSSTLLNITIYFISVIACINGSIPIGDVIKYVGFIMLCVNSFKSLFSMTQLLITNNIYLKRYFSFLDIPSVYQKGTLLLQTPDNKHVFEFVNVSFKYPNTNFYALKKINLKIKEGSMIALVGMNGSGKSTLIKLLCRLYVPTEGEILLDGKNIFEYDYDEYLKIFSVVFQNFKLYAYPLSQNVSCNISPDDVLVEECLEKVGLTKRVKSLEKGIQTCLYKEFDNAGIDISGGEAQKIAFARALYKNSQFIILDEPTAALDPIAEYEMYKNFNDIVNKKTTIYISHRMSACKFCDEIVVLNEGQLVQHGNHSDLVKDKQGKYYELWNAQAQYYQ